MLYLNEWTDRVSLYTSGHAGKVIAPDGLVPIVLSRMHANLFFYLNQLIKKKQLIWRGPNWGEPRPARPILVQSPANERP
jgi:hypothetical protein